MFATPHPIPTLSQVSTSFPQPCTVTMATSGLWRHSAAVAQCLCPYSLCSLIFVSLSLSVSLLHLAGYEWIKQLCVNLQCSFDCPFFSFVSFWFVLFFWCYFSSDLGLFTAFVSKRIWQLWLSNILGCHDRPGRVSRWACWGKQNRSISILEKVWTCIMDLKRRM